MAKIDLAKIIRICDANINRVREALRVCEEVIRFVRDDKTNARRIKKIRHQFTEIIEVFPATYTCLLESRDSMNDVGSDSVVVAKKKKNIDAILIQNIKRAQEAARVLEEFSKIIAKKSSGDFQAFRFSLYDLEKRIMLKK